MAQKRMFSKKVTNTDSFLNMPLSAQCLYFHLNMEADDDGAVGNPMSVRRKIGASEDDLKLLLAKSFLIPFEENGVLVIRHWLIHNYIRKDTYNKSIYTDEIEQLEQDETGAYTFRGRLVDDTSTTRHHRLDKIRLDKNSINTIGQNATQNSEKKAKKNLENELKSDFEGLWKLYPRKEDKERAFKAYKSAIKSGVTNQQIKDGIARYCEQLKFERTERRFIKKGGNWFAGKLWENDYGVVMSSHQQSAPPPMEQEEELSDEEKAELLKGLT